MLKTRIAGAGLGLLAATTFALAGCAGKTAGEQTPPTTAAPQVSAKDALIAASKKLNDQSAKVEMTMESATTMKATGQVDPVGKKATMSMSIGIGAETLDVKVISIAGEAWVQMKGMPGFGDKWMHIPADKVKKGSTFDIMAADDPAGTKDFIAGLATVERDGANGFKGTLDVTKGDLTDEDTIKQLGEKAKAVPFTAKVDDKGRLTTMVMDMASINPSAGKITTVYSAFGEPVTISQPPAAEVIEAPAEILEAFNK